MRVFDIEGGSSKPPAKKRRVSKSTQRNSVQVVTADMLASEMRSILDADALGYALISEVWQIATDRLIAKHGDGLRWDIPDSKLKKAWKSNNLQLHDLTGVLSLINKGSRPKYSDARRIEYAMKNGVVFTKNFSTKSNYRERALDKMGV